jgi:lipopolysaccharide transport system ATP-binding protein
MNAAAVKAEGVSKEYWIPNPVTPRWSEYARSPLRALRRPSRMRIDALSDVSFTLAEGEVLGIIGRNGAGKSTLLKILSRITSPTRGRIELRGRIASLLEVGTGFHPDLTGRENVYLNGTLLGMPSKEVDRAFAAICEFASVGAYIDVPIKRFSSGMQLRLAFAVAAHLAADTMIVDEVLAVGDAEFQRKCLGAMRDVSRNGRTTLFVSHNMSAVESLCTSVMWLDRGVIRAIGSPEQVIHEYLASGYSDESGEEQRIDLSNVARSPRLAGGRIESITFVRGHGSLRRRAWHVCFGESFNLILDCSLSRAMPGTVVGIGIRNDRGEDVLTSHSCDTTAGEWPEGSRSTRATLRVDAPWLRPGRYFVEVSMVSGMRQIDHVPEAAVLVVEEQSAPHAPLLALKKGVVSPVWTWSLE